MRALIRLLPLLAAASACLGSSTAAAADLAAPIDHPATGTPSAVLVLIHAGGWAGPDPRRQQKLADDLGAEWNRRGLRTVSIDYAEGANGLASVIEQVRALIATASGLPICLYGESAGAQLAILAAAQIDEVRCVIGLGTPVDLRTLDRHDALAPVAAPAAQQLAQRAYGNGLDALRAASPISLARTLTTPVLLLRESDDTSIDPRQAPAFTTRNRFSLAADLPSGRGPTTADAYLHGSLSTAGRIMLVAAVRRWVLRQVQSRSTARARRVG